MCTSYGEDTIKVEEITGHKCYRGKQSSSGSERTWWQLSQAGQSEEASLRRLRLSRGKPGSETRVYRPRSRHVWGTSEEQRSSLHGIQLSTKLGCRVEYNTTHAYIHARAQAHTHATVGTRPSRLLPSGSTGWSGAIKCLPALPGRDSTPGPTGPGPRMTVRATL